ncbi:MAG: ATP-binding protein, partial [Chloroflexota bacterium]|nr:ATP-binding protein [Chloroflexota bacterium]
MMQEAQIKRLIRQGEDSYTEFKEVAAHPDNLAAAIVAFANTDGGRLILGVSDEGTVIGVPDTDRAMQRIDLICSHNVEPPLICFQEKVSLEERLVLVVRVPKGPERPYRTNRGVYYIRTASGRRQASRDELRRLYQATFALFPDELPVSGTGLADLNRPYFETTFERLYDMTVDEVDLSLSHLLRNLRLVKGEELTVAGVLLFGRRPQRHLPFAHVSGVHFHGLEVGERFRDRKEIEGTLEQQVEGALAFLDLRLPLPGQIEGLYRQDKPEFPPFVLREAVVNAIVHRDYTIHGQVRVFIFDDRLEIASPGELPNTATLDSIRFGIHVERNPLLVTFLSKLGLMSRVGTGIPRMIRAMREAKLPPPEFEITDGQFR